MRARNIKPGFFKNEVLASIDPFARLLFIGLWCLADREGRLEDRPPRIKAELFPYEEIPVDALMTVLASRGLITRYSVEGAAYVHVTEFLKHQHPHPREADSAIPAEDGTRPVHVHAKVLPSPSDSPSLNPDPKGKRAPRRAPFKPPTIEEVTAYVKEKRLGVSPAKFMEYFEATEWVKANGKPVVSWKGTLLTWEAMGSGRGAPTKAEKLEKSLTQADIEEMQLAAKEGR